MPSRLKVLKPGSVNVTRVDAGPQVDDAVLAAAVGDDGADFLDQGRAAGFNRDAGQDGAGRVFDGPGDRCLCERDGRHEYRQRDEVHDPYKCTHYLPS